MKQNLSDDKRRRGKQRWEFHNHLVDNLLRHVPNPTWSLMLWLLFRRADETRCARLGYRDAAAILGRDVRYIRRVFGEMIAAGLIRHVSDGFGRVPHKYQITGHINKEFSALLKKKAGTPTRHESDKRNSGAALRSGSVNSPTVTEGPSGSSPPAIHRPRNTRGGSTAGPWLSPNPPGVTTPGEMGRKDEQPAVATPTGAPTTGVSFPEMLEVFGRASRVDLLTAKEIVNEHCRRAGCRGMRQLNAQQLSALATALRELIGDPNPIGGDVDTSTRPAQEAATI